MKSDGTPTIESFFHYALLMHIFEKPVCKQRVVITFECVFSNLYANRFSLLVLIYTDNLKYPSKCQHYENVKALKKVLRNKNEVKF